MTLVAKSAGRPRGIALSPNGRTLYVSNADDHNIRAWDVDRNGEAGERARVRRQDRRRPRRHGGGCTRATCGWPPKGIVIYSPEGKRVHLIEMHDVASGLAFGEADFKTLFIAARAVVFRARPDTQ